MTYLRIFALPFLFILCLLALPPSGGTHSVTDRPYWTERSSFIVGDHLFAVGVATRASTIEEGRQKAFEHGILEIMNYSQSPHVSELVIETQMTFEEPHPDRTFTVFRLLKVSLPKLLETKEERFTNDWESPRIREAMRRLRALRDAQSPRGFIGLP